MIPLARPNQRVGPYETVARVGAGGMGEVWKARDTRLGREVAIKFSRQQFSDRFEREVRAIAQLNHPNICTLHDVGPDYLVMEFVDGEPLRGPLPLPKVLAYASQICDALDAAHAKGITHRDLKPANILVTKDRLKLLDFGLARMEAPVPAPGDDTVTNALTGQGVVMGTPQYMAPEQIEGKLADARTDIFALGCVMYEMITGKRAFDGASASSIAAAILARDPQPVTSFQPLAPPLLEQIVNTCLAKDPAQRFQNARDLKLALQWVSGTAPAPAAAFRHHRLWLGAACVALTGFGLVFWWWLGRAHSEPLRFPVMPPGSRSADHYVDVPLPSPDGTHILFTVFNQAGRRQLAVWSLTAGKMLPLDKTDEVRTAFWSPDGQSIGFVSRGKLRRIAATGGNPQTIANVANMIGASWGSNGEILFAPANRTPLFAMPESGGPVVQATNLDASRAENSHRYPVFLPDGKHFLFTARSARSEYNCVYLGTRGSAKVTRLEGIASNAAFAPVDGRKGYLLYARDPALMARPFDAATGTFTGPERVLLPQVSYRQIGTAAAFSASLNGRLLIYEERYWNESVFQRFDRSGRLLAQTSFSGETVQPRLSPNGRLMLFSRPDERVGNRDLWVMDLERDAASPLTLHPANDWWGLWAPGGRSVYFATDRVAPPAFHVFFKGGLEPGMGESQVKPEMPHPPHDISADGRWLLMERMSRENQSGLMIADLHAHSTPEVLLDTEFNEPFGRFSPDAKWLAYMSDDSGRFEVYVRRLSNGRLDASARVAVSRNGGEYPAWDPAGRELYYLGFDRTLFAVRFGQNGPEMAPQPLFRACGESGYPGEGLSNSWNMPYDPARRGEWFVMQCRTPAAAAQPAFAFRDFLPTLPR